MNSPKKKSINDIKMSGERLNTYRAVIAGAIVVALLITACSLLVYSTYRNSLISSLTEANISMLKKSDTLLTETFSQLENMASQISLETARLINKSDDSIVYDYYRLGQLNSSLVNLKASHSYVHSAYIFFNQGNIINTSFMGTTVYRLFYDTEWYDVYRKNATKISWISIRKPYNTEFEGQSEMLLRHYDDISDVHTLLVPLSESLRSKGGVVVVNVYEKALSNLLSGDDSQKIYAVDGEGKIVISANETDLYTYIRPDLHSAIFSGNDKFHVILDSEDASTLYLYTPSKHTGLYLVSEVQLLEILRPANELLRKIAVITLLITIASVFSVLLLYYRALNPIARLYKNIEDNLGDREPTKQGSLEDQINSIIQDNNQLRTMWNNNRLLIRHRTLSSLLSGNFENIGDFNQRLRYLEIDFPYRLFTCLLIRLDIPQDSYMLLNDEYELIKMQLFPKISALIPENQKGYTIDIDDLHIGVILNFENEAPGTILKCCADIQEDVDRSPIIPYTLSIGIGSCVDNVSLLPVSFQNACSAAAFAKSIGGNEIISYSNISLSESKSQSSFEKCQALVERTLIPAIRLGQYDEAFKALSAMFELFHESGVSIDEAKTYCLSLATQISSLLIECGVNSNDAEKAVNIKAIQGSTDIGNLYDKFTELLSDVCNCVLEGRNHKKAELIEQITQYVKLHYMEDISLNQVASAVYMSVPYLCKIFKECTGRTFSDYLAGIRVEISSDKLINTNEKIATIAMQCGFTNIQTYIRTFKKYYGMTPSEYRALKVSENLESN